MFLKTPAGIAWLTNHKKWGEEAIKHSLFQLWDKTDVLLDPCMISTDEDDVPTVPKTVDPPWITHRRRDRTEVAVIVMKILDAAAAEGLVGKGSGKVVHSSRSSENPTSRQSQQLSLQYMESHDLAWACSKDFLMEQVYGKKQQESGMVSRARFAHNH